jgi:class 3 adenylate cyclase
MVHLSAQFAGQMARGDLMGIQRVVYRPLVAVDVEKYSVKDAREQLLAQEDLHQILDEAATSCGVERKQWCKLFRGDGEIAILPGNADIATIVGDFTGHVEVALRRRNQAQCSGSRLRLRVAIHYGTLVRGGPFGPAGDAPVVVSRLLDAKPLRSMLATHQERNSALIVSPSIYENVVRTRFCSLAPEDFKSVRIVIKGVAYRGCIYTGHMGSKSTKDKHAGP